jgi:hypothetical protein
LLTYFALELFKDDKLPKGKANTDTLSTVLSIIFVTLGALAVLLLIIAGVRYMLAQGDPNKVAQAKSSILHALIGLVLAASAAAIVNFAIKSL